MTIRIELEFTPVSERLPDLWGDYLAAFRQSDGCYSFSSLYFEEGQFLNKENYYGQLTHWAALPDLSEKKEEPAERIENGWYIKQMDDALEIERLKKHFLDRNIKWAEEVRKPLFSDEHQRRRDMFERVLFNKLSHKDYYLLKFKQEKKIKERWDGIKVEVPCDVLLPELLDDEYEELRVKTEAYLKAADKFARGE